METLELFHIHGNLPRIKWGLLIVRIRGFLVGAKGSFVLRVCAIMGLRSVNAGKLIFQLVIGVFTRKLVAL